MAGRAMAVVIGYEVFSLTHSTLALGGLGMVAAVPAIFGALYGGHIADRFSRRSILKTTFAVLFVCATVLSFVRALDFGVGQLWIMYVVVFVVAGAKGFLDPAATGLEAQVVPHEQLVRSAVLTALCWLIGATVGPLLGGAVFVWSGAAGAYAAIGLLCAAACLSVHGIAPVAAVQAEPRRRRRTSDDSAWRSIREGISYVARRQVLWASMMLDLFAVLLGGAIAMLPAFAQEILHVGPIGLGMLNAAPTTGALAAMLWSTQVPPIRHAGRNLLLAVAGFGVAMICFALSTSFAVSIAALFFSGMFDGFSEVIRRSTLRLLSPDRLRGRIASVNMLFVGASNELGALESGVAAALFGLGRSVWLGGAATLVLVAAATLVAPRLRRLQLDPTRRARRQARAVARHELREEPRVA